jgi:hypothetical protein
LRWWVHPNSECHLRKGVPSFVILGHRAEDPACTIYPIEIKQQKLSNIIPVWILGPVAEDDEQTTL